MKLTNEHKLYIEFSIGCALQVLPIFESKYKQDKRPRQALEAAQAFLDKPSTKTRAAAAAVAVADAAAAAAAVDAADAAVAAAAAAAVDAADAAAAYAADAAVDAAYAAYAAYAANVASRSEQRSFQVKLLTYLNFKYGLEVKIRGIE